MALQAEVICLNAFRYKLQTVRIMAIVALYIRHIHLALRKRCIDIILLQYLPVREVIWLYQECRMHIIKKVGIIALKIAEYAATGMAASTTIHVCTVVKLTGLHRQAKAFIRQACHLRQFCPFNMF